MVNNQINKLLEFANMQMAVSTQFSAVSKLIFFANCGEEK